MLRANLSIAGVGTFGYRVLRLDSSSWGRHRTEDNNRRTGLFIPLRKEGKENTEPLFFVSLLGTYIEEIHL